VHDIVDPAPRVRLESATCDDSCDPAADIAGAIPGADVRMLRLRATRSGKGNGRTYTFTYSATDFSGNQRRETAAVHVAHDQR
jgi:hypothetical protein